MVCTSSLQSSSDLKPIPARFHSSVFVIYSLFVSESSLSIENWTRVEVEHEIVKDCMMKFVKKEADDVDSLQKYKEFDIV